MYGIFKKSVIMKKMIFVVALALWAVVSAGAQDRIYFNDSRIVEAVVDEVGDNYIYYRLYNNQNGPVCSTAVYNVFKIVYNNGQEQTFPGGIYYDEGFLLDENMRALIGDKPLKMRYDSGNLYLGSRSRYGAMQADYIAFNLYGDEYYAARNSRKWGQYLVWAGSLTALAGIGFLYGDVPEGGFIFTGIGAACLGAGIPLLCKGNKRLRGIADDYNSRMQAGKDGPELTFGPCRSGVGFALNF